MTTTNYTSLIGKELKTCPFCGEGDTQIRESGKVWLGSKYSTPISVSVVHWCEQVDGQPSRMIERIGRDEESAIAAWNRRATTSDKPIGEVAANGAIAALQRLENACDKIAALRTQEQYLSMVDGAQQDALLDLDSARMAARVVLASPANGAMGEREALADAIEQMEVPDTRHCSNPELFERGFEAARSAAASLARAANGAIGEREAFEAWGNETFNYGFQPETWDDGSGPVAREAQYKHDGTQMAWDGWQARAALHAEKVTAEPVDFVFPPMPPAIVMHDKLGPLFDRLSMHFYAYKCMTIAAPQQPAQSAEQDEAAAYLVRGLDGYNEEYASVWIKRANADAAAAAIFRASITPLVQARAASTQSAATQPAQSQVALTDEQMMTAIKSVCGFDADKAEQWRPEALAIGRAVERALLREAGSN